MEPIYVIALEIGSSKIRGAAGTVDAGGTLTVIALEEEALIDCVRYGSIRNVEEVSNRVKRIIKKLENRLSPRKVTSVYVAIGGISFSSSPREIVRRLPEEQEFTEQLRSELMAEAFQVPVNERDIVDVTERRFFLDHEHVSQPVGVYAQDIRAEYNIITCRPKVRQSITRAITERVGGISVADFVVRQTAQADLVLNADEKQLGCMLVDFGAETTSVSIYKNGYLQYFATLPLGSRNITIDITALNILEDKAESYKKIGGNASADRQASRISPDGVNYDEINNYVAARAGEIIANINEQIKYADLTADQLPKGIVIVGRGAKLAGFNDRLAQEIHMPVRLGVPSAYVRYLDGHIQGYDSVDVIAILYAAARMGAKQCMSSPEPRMAEEQPQQPDMTDEERAAFERAEAERLKKLEDSLKKPLPDKPTTPPQRRGWATRILDGFNRILSDEPDEDDFV